jgi:hypothetical protein
LEEVEPLHIALLAITPEDQRHVPFERCFDYEPGIEFYNTTETFRILSERGIAATGLADRHDLGYFRAMQDFTVLMLALPRGDGVLVRSFRFAQERVIEGFIISNGFRCDSLVNWLNLVRVISFPDNAFIFADGTRYLGRTPRWVQLTPGVHQIQVETLQEVIGAQKIKLPGKIELLFKKEK